MIFSIEELYRAYRKAKYEAFTDGTQPCLLEYAKYEQTLHENLVRLRGVLKSKSKPWHSRRDIIAGHAYLPKSIDNPASKVEGQAHFSSADQTFDWKSRFGREREKADAEFRLIIVPTVDFQIISALWVLHVGRNYDAILNDKVAYANRPRKAVSAVLGTNRINDDSYALFAPYFSGYREWRENGLNAMREAVKAQQSVTAITMDARQYYHSISPRFLLSKSFLDRNQLVLTELQRKFTSDLIAALEHWHSLTPDFKGTSTGSVAVGLSASKIIANVLLAEFDRAILERLDCKYYGRYVDDIFLVIDGSDFESATSVMELLRDRLDGLVVLDRPKGASVGLRVSLPYMEDCKVVFAGSKQRIFRVVGDYGMDLVNQVADQIRKSSSEYRLIPSLKEVDEVLAGALLASTDAGSDPDTLRKAEGMSIRKHGLSIATRNLESYSRDVAPAAWTEKRLTAYGLFSRHVITPVGIFHYWKYISRVFGVMIACGDWAAATALLDKVNEVLVAIRDGIDIDEHAASLESMTDVYRRGFLEAAISASTVAGFTFATEFCRLLRRLDPKAVQFPGARVSEKAAALMSTQMLHADLGRRPYKDYWYNENPSDPTAPRVPDVPFIRQLVEFLDGFRGRLRRKLNSPYWPAFAFPTRPPNIPELCLMMPPQVLVEEGGLAKSLLVIRGAGVPVAGLGAKLMDPTSRWLDCHVPFFARTKPIKVAIPSYLTTDEQFKSALKGKPDLSLERYELLTTLINSIIETVPRVDYIALPECSVPFSWAFSIAGSLSRIGVSFICGIEPAPKRKVYRNDALVSLVTNFGGYRSSIVYRQPKLQLAHHEAESVKKAGLKKYRAPAHPLGRPIYVHGDFLFSVLLCSDLTNIDNRRALQGEVDGLFVLEWNPDVDTFSYLVESAAHDLHVPIVQINNRLYGDSRVRAPYRIDYKRDVVRIKGGDTDFYAIASFNHHKLRAYQHKPRLKSKSFKPLPIGFSASPRRLPNAKALTTKK